MTNYKEKLTKEAEETLVNLQTTLTKTQERHTRELDDIQDKIDELTFKKEAYIKAK